MIQYLIVLLDESSVSYCHYNAPRKNPNIISKELLRDAIFWAMKENLAIHFVYPEYELPDEYKQILEEVDNVKVVPSSYPDIGCADIVVFDSFKDTINFDFYLDKSYLVRCEMSEFSQSIGIVKNILKKKVRLNIVFTDVENFTDFNIPAYQNVLMELSKELEMLYANGESPQINILTDRLILQSMNNCGAGDNSIALAPNGKFYVCPAFYHAGEIDGTEDTLNEECLKGYAVGSLKDGLDIKNPQLYKLTHAPLCRHCDAYHCKRCIWLNRKMTLEVNTPSHQQCVIAHLERNESKTLLNNVRRYGSFLPESEICEIDYLDPFDCKESWDV